MSPISASILEDRFVDSLTAGCWGAGSSYGMREVRLSFMYMKMNRGRPHADSRLMCI